MKRLLAFLTLFSSFGTLICCALPALLVTLGLGAAMASFLSGYPQLIRLSEYKEAVFLFAGLMLAVSWFVRRRSERLECPIEPGLKAACVAGRRFSTVMFYGSLAIYLIGAFFAYAAPHLID